MASDKSLVQLDRRLSRRRGGPPREEIARALETLPDVSDKIAPPEEEEEGEGAERNPRGKKDGGVKPA